MKVKLIYWTHFWSVSILYPIKNTWKQKWPQIGYILVYLVSLAIKQIQKGNIKINYLVSHAEIFIFYLR